MHAQKKLSTSKDNQMRSPSLLSGPKIHKAYFEASNIKMLHQWPFDPMTLWGNIFGFEASKLALRIFGPDKSDGLPIWLSLKK